MFYKIIFTIIHKNM